MDNAGARPNTGRVRGQQEYRLVRKAYVEDESESDDSEKAISLPPRSSSNATRPVVGFAEKTEDSGKEPESSRRQPVVIDGEDDDVADDSKPAYPYIGRDARGQRLSEMADCSSAQHLESDSYKISHDALRRRLTPNPFQPLPQATRRRASSIRSTYANPDPDLDRLSRPLSGDLEWDALDTWPVPLYPHSDGYITGGPGGPFQHSQYVPYPNLPYQARHFGEMSEENSLKLERLERLHRYEMLRLHLESQERRQRCELEFRYKIETQRLSFGSMSGAPRQGQTKFPVPWQDPSLAARADTLDAKLPPWSAPDDRIRRKYMLDEGQEQKREDSPERKAVQSSRDDLAEDTTAVGTTVIGATEGYSFRPIPVADTATLPRYGAPRRQIGCLIRQPVPVPSARPLVRSVLDQFGPELVRVPEIEGGKSRHIVVKAALAKKHATRPPGLELPFSNQEDELVGARKHELSRPEIETEGSTSSGSGLVQTPTTSRSDDTKSATSIPGLRGDTHSTLVTILQRFCAAHGHTWKAQSGDIVTNSNTVTESNQPTAPSSSTGDSFGPPTSLLRPGRPSPKRRRPSRDSDSSSDEDRDGRPRRPGGFGNSGKPKKDGAKEVRLACPFRKHDPLRYTLGTHRTCVSSHWGTMARVKEHIYRAHKLLVCIRCQEEFTNERHFEAHQRADEPCQRQPKTSHEGITAEQEKKLRSRKDAHQNRNVEGQWKSVYRILFPGEEPPSPYFEELDGYAYHEYLRQRLPSYLAANLCSTLQAPNQTNQLLEAEAISATIRTCLQTLFQLFQSAQDKRPDPRGPSLPSPQTTESIQTVLDGEDQRELLIEWAPPDEQHVDAMNHTLGDFQFSPGQASLDILKDAGTTNVELSCLGFGTLQFSSDDGTTSSCINGCTEPCRHLKWDFSGEAWGMGPDGASQTGGT